MHIADLNGRDNEHAARKERFDQPMKEKPYTPPGLFADKVHAWQRVTMQSVVIAQRLWLRMEHVRNQKKKAA